MTTHAERLAALPAEQRAEILGAFTADQLLGIQYAWPFWARPDQSPPPGDWRTWLNLGGRGSGKTRTAAEWIRREVDAGRRRQIGIVGPTVEALRRVQIEGPSGILAIYPPNERPVYEMTVGRLVWPNGAALLSCSGLARRKRWHGWRAFARHLSLPRSADTFLAIRPPFSRHARHHQRSRRPSRPSALAADPIDHRANSSAQPHCR